ncbi:putative MFS peptide transporter [Pseudovirgaria hyperparasitica]|uniref:Putative MFS peptide transporter n=1 Tax=Pseudovirgaria hyperparasitica TaxID=470096 RepID=A0A6A6WBK1_9PEZI|nr:putative MFS peptide transporter [Pseudovirgaria hyperparasitica]KAF2760063.1 putative MFS peptide transporter [Pseudovirgaria hyperparasitica]
MVTSGGLKLLRSTWQAWKKLIGQPDNLHEAFVRTENQRGVYIELDQSDRDDVELYDMANHGQPAAESHGTRTISRREYNRAVYGDSIAEGSFDSKPSLPDNSTVDEPTEDEKHTLRKVPDKLPHSAFMVAIVELCERSAFYGLSGPFQNYIANKYHDPNGLPGAIGLNQAGATGLTNFFQFWCYITPIIGAVVADQYLGKYLTIVYFSVIYIAGLIILFVTSLPFVIERGAALGGLIAAMAVIGLGTGGIKANVSPLIAEQYTNTRATIRVLKSGERVIVDPAITIQRIYMIFYLCINLGSLSPIITTNLEKHVGFWSAYLVPLKLFVLGFFVLISGKKHYVVRPPRGSIIIDCFHALLIALRNHGDIDAARPSTLPGRSVNWDEQFISELKIAIAGCKVFLFYPFYWVVCIQMSNNFVSQAGQMELHGIPNDVMQNIDPITIIIFIPILDRVVYPALRRLGIQFKPMTRIFFGFLLGSAAMAYAAVVQHMIYSRAPCYDTPLVCTAGLNVDGSYAPNKIHVAAQTPAYFFIALSEIFAAVTGLEYAFTKAPTSLKSFVMSLFLLTNAFGAALAAAISPLSVDPKLVWMYAGLSVACFVAGMVFWRLYSRYNSTEEECSELEKIPKSPEPFRVTRRSFEDSREDREE